MELILVGLVFTAVNFVAMEGFVHTYEKVFPTEVEGEVEIYEVESAQVEKAKTGVTIEDKYTATLPEKAPNKA